MLGLLTLDFAKQDKWMSDPESYTAADFQPFKDSGINIIHPAVGLGGTNAYENALKWFASWNAFIVWLRRCVEIKMMTKWKTQWRK